jgi:aminoglycoside phosphotransferase (APT) family kinase protein
MTQAHDTQQSDLNEQHLKEWLSSTLGEKVNQLEISKFSAGQSNPTYKVNVNQQDYVLRRKPFGKLLPSAHAVDREFKIISALGKSGFPAPEPIALCQDENVLGVDFYLMKFVDGRIFRETTMPDSSNEQRRAVNFELMRNLTDLHKLDYKAIGLDDFERPGNYFERQVTRWTKQYRASETDSLPDVDNLIDYLCSSTPEQSGTSLIHGDYRLDNVCFHKNEVKAIAVLDWELTTIGDPLADLAYCTMYWYMPADDPFSLVNVDHAETGIPTLEEMQTHYAESAGLSSLPKMEWYYAFNMFRLVGIFQGIKKRMIDGNASSKQAGKVATLIPGLAAKGWELAQQADTH